MEGHIQPVVRKKEKRSKVSNISEQMSEGEKASIKKKKQPAE